MSYKMGKVLVLAAALVSAFASSATATSWTSNGTASGTAFTATAPAVKALVSSTPAVGIVCTGGNSSDGDWFGPGPNALNVEIITSGLNLNTCTAAGLPVTATCGAISYGIVPTGATAFGVTPVSLRQPPVSPICTVLNPPNCQIQWVANGGVNTQFAVGSYKNPTATTAGQIQIDRIGQTLKAQWTNCAIFNPANGNAPTTLTANTNPVTNLVLTVTIPAAFNQQPTFNVQ